MTNLDLGKSLVHVNLKSRTNVFHCSQDQICRFRFFFFFYTAKPFSRKQMCAGKIRIWKKFNVDARSYSCYSVEFEDNSRSLQVKHLTAHIRLNVLRLSQYSLGCLSVPDAQQRKSKCNNYLTFSRSHCCFQHFRPYVTVMKNTTFIPPRRSAFHYHSFSVSSSHSWGFNGISSMFIEVCFEKVIALISLHHHVLV